VLIITLGPQLTEFIFWFFYGQKQAMCCEDINALFITLRHFTLKMMLATRVFAYERCGICALTLFDL